MKLVWLDLYLNGLSEFLSLSSFGKRARVDILVEFAIFGKDRSFIVLN